MSLSVPISGKRRGGGKKSASAAIGGAAWQNTDGSVKNPQGFVYNIMYAPYGKDNMGNYAGEIVVNLIKELIAVIIVSFLLPCFVSTAPGADPVSRAVFIGLIAGLSVYATLKWGYNDRLPRNLTPGATVSELLGGRINWFLALLYLAVGFVGATIGGALLYATGSSAIPIVGFPNNTSIGAATMIQLCFTLIIAYTVYDQKYIRNGLPRVFRKRSEQGADEPQTESNPNPNRAYQEDIGARAGVYATIVTLVVAGCYLKWGLWAFNGYIYYAGALGLLMLGDNGAFNNVITVGSANPPAAYNSILGIAAMFILMDVLAWILAMLIDAVMYRILGTTQRNKEGTVDDSSYGGGGGDYYDDSNNNYREMAPQQQQQQEVNARQTFVSDKNARRRGKTAAIDAHLSATPTSALLQDSRGWVEN
jgi:hypothetical protein